MNDYLPYVVTGVASGSVYALAALGLVLTYKTSGFFNFAHGSVAALGATVFYEVRQVAGVPWPLAIVVTLLVVGLGGGLLLEVLARSLEGAATALKVVAAVGLLLLAQGIVTIVVGTSAVRFDPFLPTGTLRIGGVNVGLDQLIEITVCLAALGGLIWFFRVSRIGVAMRAVVESSDLLGLVGTDPVRVRRIAWVIGSTFAAVSGLFLASSIGLDAALLTLLVVQAFGAAAIGAFSNLALTYLGGLGIGIAAAFSTRYLSQFPVLRGLPPSLSFLVLVVVLVALPRRLPVDATARPRGGRLGAGIRVPDGRSFLGLVLLAAALSLIPTFAGLRVLTFTQGLLNTIQLLSLALLIRLSGQVSLCQVSFAAVGAAAFAHLAAGGVPWLLAVLVAGLIAVPVGALVAVPAIRLSGIYLAIATFGFGILLQQLLYSTSLMFGVAVGLPAPRPHVLGLDSDTGYFYVVLTAAIVIAAGILVIARSRLGRLLRALADSPVALTTAGANVNITRVVVFCLSAFIAAISGALSGPLVGRTSATDFFPASSLVLVVVLLINGRGLIQPSVRAAITLAIPAYVPFFATHSAYLAPIFGLAAIALAGAGSGRRRPSAVAEGRPRRRPGSPSGAARRSLPAGVAA